MRGTARSCRSIFVVGLIAVGVYFVSYFRLPEDDRPTFEWFGKSEPWAPPTRHVAAPPGAQAEHLLWDVMRPGRGRRPARWRDV